MKLQTPLPLAEEGGTQSRQRWEGEGRSAQTLTRLAPLGTLSRKRERGLEELLLFLLHMRFEEPQRLVEHA